METLWRTLLLSVVMVAGAGAATPEQRPHRTLSLDIGGRLHNPTAQLTLNLPNSAPPSHAPLLPTFAAPSGGYLQGAAPASTRVIIKNNNNGNKNPLLLQANTHPALTQRLHHLPPPSQGILSTHQGPDGANDNAVIFPVSAVPSSPSYNYPAPAQPFQHGIPASTQVITKADYDSDNAFLLPQDAAISSPSYNYPAPASSPSYNYPAPASSPSYNYPAPASSYNYPAPASSPSYNYPAPAQPFQHGIPTAKAITKADHALLLSNNAAVSSASYNYPAPAQPFHHGAPASTQVITKADDDGDDHVLFPSSHSRASSPSYNYPAPAQPFHIPRVLTVSGAGGAADGKVQSVAGGVAVTLTPAAFQPLPALAHTLTQHQQGAHQQHSQQGQLLQHRQQQHYSGSFKPLTQPLATVRGDDSLQGHYDDAVLGVQATPPAQLPPGVSASPVLDLRQEEQLDGSDINSASLRHTLTSILSRLTHGAISSLDEVTLPGPDLTTVRRVNFFTATAPRLAKGRNPTHLTTQQPLVVQPLQKTQTFIAMSPFSDSLPARYSLPAAHTTAPHNIFQGAAPQHHTVHTTAAQQSLHAGPQHPLKAVTHHNLPVTPQQNVHATPQHSLHILPQPSLPVTPQQSVHATPQHSLNTLSQPSLPVTPQQSVHATPQHSLNTLSQPSLPVTPQQSVHATSKHSLNTLLQQSLQITPQPGLQASPQHSLNTLPQPSLQANPLDPVQPQTFPVNTVNQGNIGGGALINPKEALENTPLPPPDPHAGAGAAGATSSLNFGSVRQLAQDQPSLSPHEATPAGPSLTIKGEVGLSTPLAGGVPLFAAVSNNQQSLGNPQGSVTPPSPPSGSGATTPTHTGGGGGVSGGGVPTFGIPLSATRPQTSDPAFAHPPPSIGHQGPQGHSGAGLDQAGLGVPLPSLAQ